MKIFFASCNHFLISSSYTKSTKMMQQLIKMLFDLTKNDSVIHFHLDIVIIRLVFLTANLYLSFMGGLCPLTAEFLFL